MQMVLVILGIIAGLICVLLIKTVMIKPTSAKTIKIELDQTERSDVYGERLARMVRHETVSYRNQQNRAKFYEFHKLLEELFPNVYTTCEKHIFNGSLLFKWSGKNQSEPVLLMSHQDVVEAAGKWDHEPFAGDIDDEGRVWGRGTVDTKASLFCIFTAVEELITEGFVPECDVYIASSCTEEWGGEGAPTTVAYLKDRGIRLKLVLDEGGMVVQNPMAGVTGTYAMMGIVEKGYGDIQFIAKSKGGHASAPGKNTPLVRLGKFMAAVDKKSPFKLEMSPVVEELLKRMAPNCDFGMRLLFSNVNIFKPLLLKIMPAVSPVAGAMLHTTLAFTMAKGSNGANVLPQEASVIGNMRFIQHQPNEESIELVRKIAAKYDIETKVIFQEPPHPAVDFKGKSFRLVESVIHEIFPGVDSCPYVMTGGTDAKYYSEVCDSCIRFAPLVIAPEQQASVHGLNENIFKGALPKGVDFYKMVIKRS